jgi:carbamoyltransferase
MLILGINAYHGDSSACLVVDEMRNIVKLKDNGLFELDTSFFLHDKEGVDMIWENGEPSLGRIFSEKLVEFFGNPREKEEGITKHHQDIAASMQAMYEGAFFHMLNDIYQKTGIDKLTQASDGF